MLATCYATCYAACCTTRGALWAEPGAISAKGEIARFKQTGSCTTKGALWAERSKGEFDLFEQAGRLSPPESQPEPQAPATPLASLRGTAPRSPEGVGSALGHCHQNGKAGIGATTPPTGRSQRVLWHVISLPRSERHWG